MLKKMSVAGARFENPSGRFKILDDAFGQLHGSLDIVIGDVVPIGLKSHEQKTYPSANWIRPLK